MARATKCHAKPHRRTRKKLKRRDCLKCDREFWSEGPHHRLCQTCRQAIASSPSPEEKHSLVSFYERGWPTPWRMSALLH